MTKVLPRGQAAIGFVEQAVTPVLTERAKADRSNEWVKRLVTTGFIQPFVFFALGFGLSFPT